MIASILNEGRSRRSDPRGTLARTTYVLPASLVIWVGVWKPVPPQSSISVSTLLPISSSATGPKQTNSTVGLSTASRPSGSSPSKERQYLFLLKYEFGPSVRYTLVKINILFQPTMKLPELKSSSGAQGLRAFVTVPLRSSLCLAHVTSMVPPGFLCLYAFNSEGCVIFLALVQSC